MGLFSGWFRKSQPPDYEQILAELANDIQKRQKHLSEIRLRERRTTLLFSIYALATWIAYVAGWWWGIVARIGGHSHSDSRLEAVLEGLPVFVGPIVILFIRRIVQIWYTRIGDKEEKQLVILRKQQREKIEEIKKATNYYTTRTLLERYDDGPRSPALPPAAAGASPNTTVKPGQDTNGSAKQPQHPQSPSAAQKRQQPRTPSRQLQQRQPGAQYATLPVTPNHLQGPISPGLQQQLSPSPQRPIPPPRKQWYDRLADAILGDEESSGGAREAASRYALICGKCFTHNGLVKESVWDDTQYICRSCGQFNPSPRSLRQQQHQPSVSPSPSPLRASFAPQEGTLAPPLDDSISRQNGPNVELLQTPKKGLRQRKGARRSSGVKPDVDRDEDEKEVEEAMEVDQDSDS